MQKANKLALVGFLLKVKQLYGNVIEKQSYEKIARDLSASVNGSFSYGLVRCYLFECEKLGLLQVSNKGGRNIRFTLIESKVKDLLGANE